jgi:hypothetical protein
MKYFYFVQDRLYLLRFSALDLRVACSGVRLCIDDNGLSDGLCWSLLYPTALSCVYLQRPFSFVIIVA